MIMKRKMAVEHMLPQAVRDNLLANEQKSEVIISSVQMIIVLSFAALFYAQPSSPEYAERTLGIETIVIWSYVTFSAFRFFWSRRTRLPNWALNLSALFDITLLMILIWSFHLKYAQPAPFYLKAPTQIYIFLFISLRCLRFEPSLVLHTGLIAAAGWAIMTVVAIQTYPGAEPITRDFSTYILGARVMIGAEADKIIIIIAVTLLLTASLHRGRKFLVTALREQSASEALSRFFDPSVADRIRSADEAINSGDGEMREIAIVFTDLRGFTPLVERHPAAEIMALLSDYQRLAVPIITAHGGAIDKFMGDGILATFGAATPSTTAAAQAVAAVEALCEEAQKWQDNRQAEGKIALKLNAGLACGQVLFGTIGYENRLEYTVIGDAVNLAAKLEKHNKVEKVQALCNLETYQRAQQQGHSSARKRRIIQQAMVEGVKKPMDLCVLGEART